MCYSMRKPVIRRDKAKDTHWMSAPQAREAHQNKAYAEAYTKTKEIMRKLFRTKGKEQASAT